MYESQDKMVSHPSHYQSESGLEVITVIEAFTTNLDGMEAYDTGNILKYICRWKQKNGVQDLEKAAWYLQHLIDHVKKDKKQDDVLDCSPRQASIENPLFSNESDAKFFVEAMQTLLKDYKKVSVLDAKNIIGRDEPDVCDTEYGWTDLSEMGYYYDITTKYYTVVLPKVEKL